MPWSKERRKEANAIRPAGTNRLCCVPLCDYNTLAYWRRPGAQLRSMHMFPNDHARRQQWVENIQRRQPDGMPWEPAEASRVCSIHFSEACFLDRFIARGVKYRGRARVNKRLANFAIPTIFPGYPPDIIVPHQIQPGAKHFTPDMKRTRKRREDNQLLNTPIVSFDNLVNELRDKIRLAQHWHVYRTGVPPPPPNDPYSLADPEKEQQQQPQDEQEQDNTLTLTCLNYANIEQPRVCGWIIIDDSLDTIVHVPGSIVLEARLQNIIATGGRTRNNLADYKPEPGTEHRLVTWTQLSRLVREIERPVKIEMAERSAAMSFYAIGGGAAAPNQEDIKPSVSIGSVVNVQGANGQPVSGRIISVTSNPDSNRFSLTNNVDRSNITRLAQNVVIPNHNDIMQHQNDQQTDNETATDGAKGANGNGGTAQSDNYDDDEMFADAEAADTSAQNQEQYEDDTDDEEEQHAYENAFMDAVEADNQAYRQLQQQPQNNAENTRNDTRFSQAKQQHGQAPYRLFGGKVVDIQAPKREADGANGKRQVNRYGNQFFGRGKAPVVYKSQRVNLVMGGAGDEAADEQEELEQEEAEH